MPCGARPIDGEPRAAGSMGRSGRGGRGAVRGKRKEGPERGQKRKRKEESFASVAFLLRNIGETSWQ